LDRAGFDGFDVRHARAYHGRPRQEISMRIGISVSSSYLVDDPRISSDQAEALATIGRLAEVKAALAP
jgi:hypothetical protein